MIIYVCCSYLGKQAARRPVNQGYLVVLSLLIQVTVTRFGLGMWQTITILKCPPRRTLLEDPTVKT